MIIRNRQKILEQLNKMIQIRENLIETRDIEEYHILQNTVKLIEEIIYLNEGYVEDLKEIYKLWLKDKFAKMDATLRPIETEKE